MDKDLKVAVQVAAEAIIDQPDAFTKETYRSVLRAAEAAGTPEWVVQMLREVPERG